MRKKFLNKTVQITISAHAQFSWLARKMATANPVEEIHNLNVDASEVTAVYDSLQSQLLSPTLKAQISSSFPSSVGVNNSGIHTLAAQTSSVQSSQALTSNSYMQTPTSLNIQNLNGSKTMIGGVPVSYFNPNANTVISQGLNIMNNQQIQNIQVKSEPNHSPKSVSGSVQRINTLPMNTVHTTKQQNNAVGGGNMLNLANVAAAQRPIYVPHTTVKQQIMPGQDTKPVFLNVLNSNSVQRPQLVIKDEKPVKSEPLDHRHSNIGNIRIVNQPNQVTSAMNVIQNSHNIRALTPSSTSVVMTRPMANPQTVTVVRPTITSTVSVPNQFIGHPQRVQTSINRPMLQRPPAGAPLRIAPNQQPAIRRSPGVRI